jgi:formamidopyrimidine-DNA glycosylase
MPELPEVETTRLGIIDALLNQTITDVVVRNPYLRKTIPDDFAKQLTNQLVVNISRRGKYLIVELADKALLIHLGMSGSLRVITNPQLNEIKKHDHVDIYFSPCLLLRYHDPRRFGLMEIIPQPSYQHASLLNLGVEPFSDDCCADFFIQKSRHIKTPIKAWIMNQRVIVGVGNIYATEALFLTKIHPLTPTQQLSFSQWEKLIYHIQGVLNAALQSGGSTLKDYVNSNGKQGFFTLKLLVYGKAGKPCSVCNNMLQEVWISQRRSVYCNNCQPLKN